MMTSYVFVKVLNIRKFAIYPILGPGVGDPILSGNDGALRLCIQQPIPEPPDQGLVVRPFLRQLFALSELFSAGSDIGLLLAYCPCMTFS